MKKNKKTIKITAIKNHGRCHEMYCDKILMLRSARNVGDIETVNHYVLGVLRQHSGCEFDFIEINN